MIHTPRLLHNMSAPPRTTIRYEGSHLGGCVLLLQLPPSWTSSDPATLLSALGIAAGAGPEAQLLALVTTTARDLPLPDACVVLPACRQHEQPWGDPLVALTVLSQCSSSLWLRAKRPAFAAALARREVRLLVPTPWSDAFPLEPQP